MNPGEYSRWSKLDRPWFIEIQRIHIAEILTTITMSVVLLTNSGGIVGRRIRGIGSAVAVSDYDRESRIYHRPGLYRRSSAVLFEFRFPFLLFILFLFPFDVSFLGLSFFFFPSFFFLWLFYSVFSIYTLQWLKCVVYTHPRCHAKCNVHARRNKIADHVRRRCDIVPRTRSYLLIASMKRLIVDRETRYYIALN